MNGLTKLINKGKDLTLGIDGVVDALPSEFSDERSIIKVCEGVNAHFVRVIVENMKNGFWVARYRRFDDSKVQKEIFREGELDNLMSFAITGVRPSIGYTVN